MPTLDWIGKKAVVNHHQEVPYRLIHCNGELSAGDPDAGNLLVEGDNLVALKALLPYYAGKVKCIYIDPPFNTGSEEWQYDDNVNSPEIKKWLGEVVGREADDLCRHDKWLCMMYPRLRILREFLCKEGTLFVHIDDNEIAHAIILCDEIFGARNKRYIVTFKQASATGHKSINPGCVNVTNNILIYSKEREYWNPNRVFTGRDRDKRYNQFIQNRAEPYERWRFTTLMSAFAASKNLSLQQARKLTKENPDLLDDFVLSNADSVIQPARPDYANVGQETRDIIDRSVKEPNRIFRVTRKGYSDIFLKGGMRILFYSDKIKMIDGVPIAGEPLTTLWDDVLSNNLHQEGGSPFRKGKSQKHS
jgi:adenine-specific DNA-methyltransferase